MFLRQKRNEVISWVLSTSIVVSACSEAEGILNWLLATGFILWWDGCLLAEDLPSPAPVLGWLKKEKLPFDWGDEIPPW
jgi:hypothetical protein